jgi:hypothetical protein
MMDELSQIVYATGAIDIGVLDDLNLATSIEGFL